MDEHRGKSVENDIGIIRRRNDEEGSVLKETMTREDKFLVFENQETGKTKRVKIGFGWDFLFFGVLVFLFRGFFKEFVLLLILFGILDYAAQAFLGVDTVSGTAAAVGTMLGMYGNLYMTYELHKKGWILKKPAEKTQAYAVNDWTKRYFKNNKDMTAAQYLDSLMRPYMKQKE